MDAQSEEADHVVVEDDAEDSDEEHECRVCRGPAEEGWVENRSLCRRLYS